MKKLMGLVIFMVVLLKPLMGLCAPFLVCDTVPTTQTQPNYYLIVPDGGAPITSPAQVMPDSSVRIHHDMAGVTTGPHSWTVAACSDLWGCSAAVPFGFTKAVPGGPANTRLSAN